MLKVHGIANCETVKKARAWLDAHAIDFEWVDFRKTPPTREQLAHWIATAGRDKLVNRRGTSWRKLPPAQQAALVDDASAIALMQAVPALIKRPVVETDGELCIGFDAGDYARRFLRR